MRHQIPEIGFLRLKQIIGDPKKNIPPILPLGKSSWWAGVAKGIYPKPIKFGGCTCWRVEDIRKLVEEGITR